MNREQAKKLIRNTFESPFSKEKFIVFIKNLLNRIEESPIHRGNLIPDAFKQYITSLERIGKYTDGENEIDLLIVKLKRETSLERARTMQRNFIARYLRYLKGSRGGKLKDAALVAFVSPDEEDWRFSLVKMDYRFKEKKSGGVEAKEEFTPARRWSFLVGKNEKSHTAQSRLVSILEDDEHNPTLAQLEEAFNIEPVTKEFFDKYRDLLIRTVDALDKIVKGDQTVRKDFESKNTNTVDFAKKLLGQIVFLYFLQKKGWFGVKRDAEWGTGAKDFLRRLFNKEYGDYKNFFNDILEPLFYEALARERDDNFYSRFNCKIPFLNGGLFEPIGGYDWVHTDILLPDDLFSNSRRTPEGDIGDGILDVFDRFNFTVKEDEPLEKEVAIDPELLGKLYEKFNAVRPDNFYEYKKALASGKRSLEKQFNKKFGVYYTPREIVHYMCQQSLIYYLSAELEGKVSKEDIEKLIKFGEQFTENEATALIKERRIKEGKQKTSDYELKLPKSIRKNAKLIDDKLRDIKICDPAVGSGAFLVGMMHEIVKTRKVLSTFINEPGRTTYNFKRECIENSLYGVDIDAGACEVAKLRLWLSLIVDEEDIRKIKPLPNLDYKIVQGNSLLGVEKDLFNIKSFNQLEKLKPLYFNETNPAKKQEYKNQIEELISKITKGRREFDFEVYFSEVFHQKGGFDVVIANPPYGLLNKKQNKSIGYEISEEEKKQYKKMKEFSPAIEGMVNIYKLFIIRGINILKHKGFFIQIFPLAFICDISASKLRKWILDNFHIVGIEAFPERDNEKTRVFDSVKMSVCILKVIKAKSNNASYIRIHWNKYVDELNEKVFIDKSDIKLLDSSHFTIPLIKNRDFRLLRKIYSISEKLSSVAHCYTGEIDLTINKKYLSDDPKKAPLLKGAMIDRYLLRKKMSQGEIKFLDSEMFLNENSGAKSHHYKMPRLVMQGITGINEKIRLKMTIINSGIFCANSVNYIISREENMELKYYLALLNSSLLNYIFKLNSTNSNVNGYEIDNLPIMKISLDKQRPFIDLVNKILSLTQSEDYLENPQKQAKVKEYERQIDQLVYKLYDLTDEEIKIVENLEKNESE